MLEYSLHENLLTDRKDDFVAQTHCKTVYTREQFIDLMLQRGTLVTKTDIVAVLNNLEETALYIIENGGSLNLPLFNTSFSITGVFDGAMDSFDANRHKLNVNIHKGTLLKTAEKAVKITKVNTPSPQPQILEVKDSVSGKVDEILTSGGVIEISGINIKITGENPSCGIWFVSADGVETKAATIAQNKPASVIALVPALAPGYYNIKLVTQYAGSRDLKEPKTTVYDKSLQA